MACPFLETALLARGIFLIAKKRRRRITLGVRLSMMQFYSRTMALFINPILRGRRLRSIDLSPGFSEYRMSIMQLNVGQIT
jgi:hypothetical protein